MNKGFRILLILAVVVSLIFSVYFSFNSLTGYIVYENVTASYNLLALGLLLIGIGGAMVLARKKRDEKIC